MVREDVLTPSRAAALRILILLAVAMLALAQSWNRWLDPIIDTGRDLYIPEQLLRGAKLYRDIRYQYPPLTPYALAAITRVIGASLAAFTAVGIAQSIAIAALLWAMLRNTAGFAAALLFLALSFTGASTWGANFIFPYAYGATFGMLFLIAALAAFVWQRNAIALLALLLASLCKLEYAAGALLIVAVLTMLRRVRIGAALGFVAALFITYVAVTQIFGPAFRQNVLAASLTRGETAQHFFRNVSGVAEWPRHLAMAIASAAVIAVIARLLRARPKVGIAAVLVAAVVFNSDSFFRGWAILQFVALGVAIRDRKSPLLLFAVFSVASTIRVYLNVSPQWYGSVLVVPVFALAAYLMFRDERTRSIWWLAIVLAISGRDLFEQHERFAVKAFPIRSARGVFYDYNADRARTLNELIAAVRGPTLTVFPEGASINYFTRTRTPISQLIFTPPETADPAAENFVLLQLRSQPPDEVAIVTRDVSEFGFRGFGIDYDRHLFTYLLEKYRFERTWTDATFQCLLLRNMSR